MRKALPEGNENRRKLSLVAIFGRPEDMPAALWKEVCKSFDNVGRDQHLGVSNAELKTYRRAKSVVEICELDRSFFEKHKEAISCERPLFALELPPCYFELPGKVMVLRVDAKRRIKQIERYTGQN